MTSIKKKQFQIFEHLEVISNSIFQSTSPNFLNENLLISEVAKSLKLNNLQACIVSITATKGPNVQVITEANLIQIFTKFNLNRSEIILTIKQLQRIHILNKQEFRESDNLELTRKYSRYLETDNWDGIHEAQAAGILPLLKRVFNLFGHEERSMMRRHFDMMNSQEEMHFEDELVLEENENLAIVKYVTSNFQRDTWENYTTQLFFYTIARKVLLDETTVIDNFLSQKDISQWERKAFLHDEIINGKWAPLSHGFFEIHGSEQLTDEIELMVTDEGIQQLLPELDSDILHSLLHCKTITVPHMKVADIKKAKLIFDDATWTKLKPIHRSMQPNIRKKIQEKLGGRNLGLTALFYGYPGTGKTEFCYQLAKEFNLPIYEVNVAQIQNKWVGESEKNARKVFQQYRKLKKQSGQDCILLFNEADALLGRRLTVNSSVDSMNNAVKNIFLEEIERFDGILLATTNLTENMDLAFERRFLFKVFFNRPEIQTSAKIWQQYFKGLKSSEATELAKKFNFSPGEITNVHTRFEIEKILGNRTQKFKLIEQLCQEERIKAHTNRNTNAVGFG